MNTFGNQREGGGVKTETDILRGLIARDHGVRLRLVVLKCFELNGSPLTFLGYRGDLKTAIFRYYEEGDEPSNELDMNAVWHAVLYHNEEYTRLLVYQDDGLTITFVEG